MEECPMKSDGQYIEPSIYQGRNDASRELFTHEDEKKLIRCIDRRLVMTLGLLYMCSLMDRTNLSIANIAG